MNRGLVITVGSKDARRASELVEKLGYRWMSVFQCGDKTRIQIPVATAYASEIAHGIEETLWDENIECKVRY